MESNHLLLVGRPGVRPPEGGKRWAAENADASVLLTDALHRASPSKTSPKGGWQATKESNLAPPDLESSELTQSVTHEN